MAAAVDKQTAEAAMRFVWPAIERALADRSVFGTGCMHVVIMDPSVPPGSCAMEAAILHEVSAPSRERWDADYQHYARKKAAITWRTGLDSHTVQAVRPHLLRDDDERVWGSVCIDGIVVAVSGAQPWYDEAIATMIAGALKAVVKGRTMTGAD